MLPKQNGCALRRLNMVVCMMLVSCLGCWRSPDNSVVIVYTALDREFSEEILDAFTDETGIQVHALYDVESNKTIGLANRIVQEQQRPNCDLFWNNEILHTLRLGQKGLLAAHQTTKADSFPAQYRSLDGTWFGFAARARVLIVNTQQLSSDEYPRSIEDLADPKWAGRVGIAKPLFGTTATHAACLFDRWGDERAREFFRKVRSNAVIHAGNKQVAQAVASGALAFGITDTDDAMIEVENGFDVMLVYPDQGEGQIGTMFIPNTISLIRGAPRSDSARQLIDYLLTPEVEIKLARGRSAQIPLNEEVTTKVRVETPQTIRAMEVDFASAAKRWDAASAFLRELFVSTDE